MELKPNSKESKRWTAPVISKALERINGPTRTETAVKVGALTTSVVVMFTHLPQVYEAGKIAVEQGYLAICTTGNVIVDAFSPLDGVDFARARSECVDYYDKLGGPATIPEQLPFPPAA